MRGTRQTVSRDFRAGDELRRLREDHGLSQHDLAVKLVREHPRDSRYHVSERTIRRIEDNGVIPTVRVKFALAGSFDLLPSALWGAPSRRRVAA